MANDGEKCRKITKINACDKPNLILLWVTITDVLVALLYGEMSPRHRVLSNFVQMLKSQVLAKDNLFISLERVRIFEA
ncbi:hypothetical protein BZZ01_27430 [Nostocales cyanobacterium HT-58-2]|nr:hypothetical protein BZZ01_27430 [Nostocales cyanobacterium HT-58-2]